jgi:antitoxin YefM
MEAILNATEVRANFSGFFDSVVRERPQFVKRNRDIIAAVSHVGSIYFYD